MKQGEKRDSNEKEHATPPAGLKRLRLNTLKNVRVTFQRIIAEYKNGRLPDNQFKNLVYGISQLAHIYRIESELEQDKRIEAIEKALQEMRG